jgi:hypothetical protein
MRWYYSNGYQGRMWITETHWTDKDREKGPMMLCTNVDGFITLYKRIPRPGGYLLIPEGKFWSKLFGYN